MPGHSSAHNTAIPQEAPTLPIADFPTRDFFFRIISPEANPRRIFTSRMTLPAYLCAPAGGQHDSSDKAETIRETISRVLSRETIDRIPKFCAVCGSPCQNIKPSSFIHTEDVPPLVVVLLVPVCGTGECLSHYNTWLKAADRDYWVLGK